MSTKTGPENISTAGSIAQSGDVVDALSRLLRMGAMTARRCRLGRAASDVTYWSEDQSQLTIPLDRGQDGHRVSPGLRRPFDWRSGPFMAEVDKSEKIRSTLAW